MAKPEIHPCYNFHDVKNDNFEISRNSAYLSVRIRMKIFHVKGLSLTGCSTVRGSLVENIYGELVKIRKFILIIIFGIFPQKWQLKIEILKFLVIHSRHRP